MADYYDEIDKRESIISPTALEANSNQEQQENDFFGEADNDHQQVSGNKQDRGLYRG